MAQLFATFGVNVNLLVIQAVNFGITLAVLAYFLFRPLMKILGERKEKIAKGVADADAAAQTKKETENARSGIISGAEREAEKIVNAAVVEGKDERSHIVKSAQERSDSLLADARTQAEELQRRALAESQKDVARMAVLAAEKILKES